MLFKSSLTFLFAKVANSFRDKLDKHLKEVGLHGGQVFILFSLWDQDGQSQIALAQSLGLSPPTINKMVKSLTANDFVECRKCDSDGRLLRVFLAAKGSECRGAVELQWQTMEADFFSQLTGTEKLILMQILEKIKDNKKII